MVYEAWGNTCWIGYMHTWGVHYRGWGCVVYRDRVGRNMVNGGSRKDTWYIIM